MYLPYLAQKCACLILDRKKSCVLNIDCYIFLGIIEEEEELDPVVTTVVTGAAATVALSVMFSPPLGMFSMVFGTKAWRII